MTQLQRLTPERLGDILAAEAKAVALFDEAERPIGVELPMPDGMTYEDGSTTRTALFGDRVGQDRYGQWLVFPAHPAP
jgi:hypothetical protein